MFGLKKKERKNMERNYEMVKPQDVKAGDVLRIEFGDFDNFVNCIILKEGTVDESGTIHFYAKRCADGVEFDFYTRTYWLMCKIG